MNIGALNHRLGTWLVSILLVLSGATLMVLVLTSGWRGSATETTTRQSAGGSSTATPAASPSPLMTASSESDSGSTVVETIVRPNSIPDTVLVALVTAAVSLIVLGILRDRIASIKGGPFELALREVRVQADTRASAAASDRERNDIRRAELQAVLNILSMGEGTDRAANGV